MYKSLPDLIANTSELAALPTTTVQLLELLDDSTVEAERVLAVIGKDPALTSNLLKLCNSAYYGVRRQVGSVKEALVLLGNQTVVTLAFATSMGDVLRGQLSAYGLAKEEMWHHALATALGAAYLITYTPAKDYKDRAFTAGLVHDIGKLLLNGPLTQQLEQLPPQADGVELLAAERRILGFDHCEAGAALADAWNFPPMLTTAVQHHHRLEDATEETELLRAVYAANLITISLGLGCSSRSPVPLQEVEELTELGITEEAIVHLSSHLAKDLEDLLSLISEPV
ncbi:MAG: HDOD domain-containing protein [bacterium]